MRDATRGRTTGAELAEARLQLHHALQLVSIGLGRSLAEAAEDDSHTSVQWDVHAARWYGPALPGTPGFRGFLEPAGLKLGLLDGHAEVAAQRELPGRTLLEALAWLRDEVGKRGAGAHAVSLASHFDIPDHPVAHGIPFPAPGQVHREIAERFAEAQELLEGVRARWPGAGTARLWPHHFDLGALLPLPGDDDSVGVGFSCGDEHYDEPYFYVSPYPNPEPEALPPLAKPGHWKTVPFVSAILTEAERRAAGGSRETVEGFLERAVAAARSVAGAAGAG